MTSDCLHRGRVTTPERYEQIQEALREYSRTRVRNPEFIINHPCGHKTEMTMYPNYHGKFFLDRLEESFHLCPVCAEIFAAQQIESGDLWKPATVSAFDTNVRKMDVAYLVTCSCSHDQYVPGYKDQLRTLLNKMIYFTQNPCEDCAEDSYLNKIKQGIVEHKWEITNIDANIRYKEKFLSEGE